MDRRIEVERGAGDRLAAREMLHLVDQRRDTVDLCADEGGEAFAVGDPLPREELRGALDAGERILDLVRQNGGGGTRDAGRQTDGAAPQYRHALRRNAREEAVAVGAIGDQ